MASLGLVQVFILNGLRLGLQVGLARGSLRVAWGCFKLGFVWAYCGFRAGLTLVLGVLRVGLRCVGLV